MVEVVLDLDLAPPVRLVDRGPHRGRDPVGVHDHAAFDVPRRAADDLDERALGTEVALFVGVEDRDERHLGQVDAFTQEVHAHHHVVHAEP